MNDAPVLLDDALHPVAILENASFGWTLQHNDLCTAELRLPCEDAANDLCAKLPWVHLQDGVRDLGVYRITGMPASDVLLVERAATRWSMFFRFCWMTLSSAKWCLTASASVMPFSS